MLGFDMEELSKWWWGRRDKGEYKIGLMIRMCVECGFEKFIMWMSD